jgi:hypothetical protein
LPIAPNSWGHHARYGLDAGLSEAELAALGRRDGAGEFADDGDRLVIAVVDEMVAGGDMPSRDRLAAALGTPALVDLVWTVGQYVGLSLVADTLALPVEGLRPAPPHPGR